MFQKRSGPPFIRTTERKDFGRCQQRWYWAWRAGLKGKGRPAAPLWFGIGIHEALAQWYQPGTKRGVHPADYWLDWYKGEEQAFIKALTANSDSRDDAVWVDAKSLGEAMLTGYVERYGADEDWEILYVETPFQIEIPRPGPPSEFADPLAIFAGTFDGVYRDLRTGKIWLVEHKTAKQISTIHLPLDRQAGGYWAIASRILQHRGVLKKGDRIEGIMYNFLRKSLPDDRPTNDKGEALNKNGTVSKNQPSPLFLREPVFRDRRERATQLRAVQREAKMMDYLRRHPEDINKNPTRDCSWDCAFYEMCLLQEKGGDDWKDYRDAVFTRADPYADHRKSAAE